MLCCQFFFFIAAVDVLNPEVYFSDVSEIVAVRQQISLPTDFHIFKSSQNCFKVMLIQILTIS